jgi:hypothetical protein
LKAWKGPRVRFGEVMMQVARHQFFPGTRRVGDEDRRRVRSRRAREEGVERVAELPGRLAVPDHLGTAVVVDPPPSTRELLNPLLCRDL